MTTRDIKSQVAMQRLYTELGGQGGADGKRVRCLLPQNHKNGDDFEHVGSIIKRMMTSLVEHGDMLHEAPNDCR